MKEISSTIRHQSATSPYKRILVKKHIDLVSTRTIHSDLSFSSLISTPTHQSFSFKFIPNEFTSTFISNTLSPSFTPSTSLLPSPSSSNYSTNHHQASHTHQSSNNTTTNTLNRDSLLTLNITSPSNRDLHQFKDIHSQSIIQNSSAYNASSIPITITCLLLLLFTSLITCNL